jgi:hypothetical protein
MRENSPATRLPDNLEAGDCNWIINTIDNFHSQVISDEKRIRFSISLRSGHATQLFGRFELDLTAAEQQGLIKRELRNDKLRIRIERNNGELFIKLAGDASPCTALHPRATVVRLDLKHAYRWGFNKKLG